MFRATESVTRPSQGPYRARCVRGGFEELGGIRLRVRRIGRNSLEASENWEEFAGGFEELGGIRWRIRRIGSTWQQGSRLLQNLHQGRGNAGATAAQLDLIKSVLLACSQPKLLKVGPLVQIFR